MITITYYEIQIGRDVEIPGRNLPFVTVHKGEFNSPKEAAEKGNTHEMVRKASDRMGERNVDIDGSIYDNLIIDGFKIRVTPVSHIHEFGSGSGGVSGISEGERR